MRRVEINEREYEVVKKYKKIAEELKKVEKEIAELKGILADEESVELIYNGYVIGKILVVNVRRVDVNSLPPEIKEAYTKTYKDKRLVINGIPLEPENQNH
jgi:KaiC/GvpD/RAD55 family RecA-like ATPase